MTPGPWWGAADSVDRSPVSIDTGQPVFPIAFRELAAIPNMTPPMWYHSLVAELGRSLQRYREFVIFHNERVLPQYLIAYQRFDGDKLLRE